MPSEAQYYWEVFWDLLNSWRPRSNEHREVLVERRRKLVLRIPRALKQYKSEANAMEELTSADRKGKATRQALGVLGDAVVARLQSSDVLLGIRELESNKHLRLAKEKLEVVAEESFPLLALLNRREGGNEEERLAADPILPAMRGNLHLRILELHDVLAVVRGTFADEDASTKADDTQDGANISAADILFCIEYFVAYADEVGASCDVLVCTPRASHSVHGGSGVSTIPSGESAAATLGRTSQENSSSDNGYCSVM